MTQSLNTPKIIFMGTPEFGAVILNRLCQTSFKPILVVTSPDKPTGRKQIITPSPVKVLAEKQKIPVLQPLKVKDNQSEIKNIKPDLIILAAYGQIIPEGILNIPKYGCLNIHPSLLPRWRGPSPVQFAVLQGDDKTGVTIMKITEDLDAGPILVQKKIKILDKETALSLYDKLGELGGNLLVKIIPEWVAGKIKPVPQDDSQATYSKIIKKEDGKINWHKSAEEIERQIRAFNPWPGSWTNWYILKNKIIKIKILKSRVHIYSANQQKFPVGKILVVPQNEIGVKCKKNILVVEELQIEGKKPTKSEDFLRGHPDFVNTLLR